MGLPPPLHRNGAGFLVRGCGQSCASSGQSTLARSHLDGCSPLASCPFEPHAICHDTKVATHSGSDFCVAEGVGLEPTRPLTGSQFSKLLRYHSAQPSM